MRPSGTRLDPRESASHACSHPLHETRSKSRSKSSDSDNRASVSQHVSCWYPTVMEQDACARIYACTQPCGLWLRATAMLLEN